MTLEWAKKNLDKLGRNRAFWDPEIASQLSLDELRKVRCSIKGRIKNLKKNNVRDQGIEPFLTDVYSVINRLYSCAQHREYYAYAKAKKNAKKKKDIADKTAHAHLWVSLEELSAKSLESISELIEMKYYPKYRRHKKIKK
jgi:hypothetical protein